MQKSAYIGGEDRHNIRDRLEVVSAGHMVMDERSAAFSGPSRPKGFPDYQIIYIRKGLGHFYFETGEQRVTAGHAVLFLPHQPQIYRYFREDRPEVYWLHFGGTETAALLRELGLGEKQVLPLTAEGDLPRLAAELIIELQLQRPGFRTACRGLLLGILTRVSRSAESQTAIRQVCLAMAADYAKPITNEALARECGMSLSTFAHLFKQETGVSPREYLLQQRLSAARFLLENSYQPIGQVAAAVGFRDALYFSKFFHTRTGMSPTEYRDHYTDYFDTKQ
ncbi:MAG: AraC family transcriptional regulator [Clostridia bacterium]|nr:AraC family transcriptional regulator [Clostridia bacterium]